MPIEFPCPSCSKKLKVAEALAGKKVRCTQCQKVVAVPSPVQMTGVEAEGPAATGSSKPLTVLDGDPEGEFELDLPPDVSAAKPGAKPAGAKPDAGKPAATAPKPPAKAEAAKPAAKPAAEAPKPSGGDGYDLADDEPPPSPAAKKAMTVLDDEADFGGFEVDDDVPAASLVNKAAPGKTQAGKEASDLTVPPTGKRPVPVNPANKGEDAGEADGRKPAKAAKSAAPAPAGGAGYDITDDDAVAAEITGKPEAKAGDVPDDGTKAKAAPPPPKAAGGAGSDLKNAVKAGLLGGIRDSLIQAGIPAGVVYAAPVAILAVVIGIAALVFFAGGGKTPPSGVGTDPLANKDGGSGAPPVTKPGGTVPDPKTPKPDPKGAGTPPDPKAPKTGTPVLPPVDEEEFEKKAKELLAPVEAAAVAPRKLGAEFWTRYEAAVAAGTADAFKGLSAWCRTQGLDVAAEDARRVGRLLAPDDPALQPADALPVTVGGKTLYTSPAARAAVDALVARLVVTNRAHPEVRLTIKGEAAPVPVKMGQTFQRNITKPGILEFRIATPDGSGTDFREVMMPGAGVRVELIPPSRMPVVPTPALTAAIYYRKLLNVPQTPAMPPKLGSERLMEFRTEAGANPKTYVVLCGQPDTPYAMGDQVPMRPQIRKKWTVEFDGGPDEPLEGRTVRISEGDRGGNVTFRPVTSNLAAPMAGGLAMLGQLQVGPVAGAAGTPAFDDRGRLLAGSVLITGFPLSTEEVCAAAGLDPDVVQAAIDAGRLNRLVVGNIQIRSRDLAERVTTLSDIRWVQDDYYDLCNSLDISPQPGCIYARTPLGVHARVGWLGRELSAMLESVPTPEQAAALAVWASQARTELLARVAEPKDFVRPYAAVLLSWPGHDEAVPHLVKLADEYRGDPLARVATDAYMGWLTRHWSSKFKMHLSIPAALRTIGTKSAVAALAKIADDPVHQLDMRRECVRQLAQMLNPDAAAFLGELAGRISPDLRNEVLVWLGRWDMKVTRKLVDERLRQKSAAGLRELAEAYTRQPAGTGNLHILRSLSEYDAGEGGLELVRRATGIGRSQEWKWDAVALLKGAQPRSMLRSVLWMAGRRGDLPAAHLMASVLAGRKVTAGPEDRGSPGPRALFVAGLPEGRPVPEFVFPLVKPGEQWNARRFQLFGDRETVDPLTQHEESFARITGPGADLLLPFLAGLTFDKEVRNKGLLPWTVKLAGNAARPSIRPILTWYFRAMRDGHDPLVDLVGRLAAGLALLKLGDPQSLGVVAGDPIYETLFDRMRDNFLEQRQGGGGGAVLARILASDTELANEVGRDWDDYQEAAIWSVFEEYFETVPEDRRLRAAESITMGDPAYEKRVRFLEKEYARGLSGTVSEVDTLADRRRPQGAAKPARGADAATVAKILEVIVWPVDSVGGSLEAGREFRLLQRRALLCLLSLVKDDKLSRRLATLFDNPAMSDIAMEAAVERLPKDDADLLKKLAERATGVAKLEYKVFAARRRMQDEAWGRRERPLLDQMAGKEKHRLNIADTIPMLRRRVSEPPELLVGDPTYDAIAALGRMKSPGATAILRDIVDGKAAKQGVMLSRDSAENELLRQAAAIHALARNAATPQVAKDVRDRIETVLRERVSLGLAELQSSERPAPNQTPEALAARQRAILQADYRRNIISALRYVAGPNSATALIKAVEYASDLPGASVDPSPIRAADKALNEDALVPAMELAGPDIGPKLAVMLAPDTAKRMGLTAGSPLSWTLMRVIELKCRSTGTAKELVRLLSSDEAEGSWRIWALNNLVYNGGDSELQELTDYVRTPGFGKLTGALQRGDALIGLIQSVRAREQNLQPAAAADFLRRVLRANASTVAPDKDEGALLSLLSESQALLGLREIADPAAAAALADLRKLPRYSVPAAILGWNRGVLFGAAGRDDSAIAHLTTFASVARGDPAGQKIALSAVRALTDIRDPRACLALAAFVEQSGDLIVRTAAAGAMASLTIDLSRPGSPSPPPAELTGRILEMLKNRPPAVLQVPLYDALAAVGSEEGLAAIAAGVADTPSRSKVAVVETPFDLHHVTGILDLLADRRKEPTPGLIALVEALLLKRRQPEPLDDPLYAAACEFAARAGVFEARKEPPADHKKKKDELWLSELLKARKTRLVVSEAIALHGRTPAVRDEAKAFLNEMRNGKGAAKAIKEEEAELTAALARVARIARPDGTGGGVAATGAGAAMPGPAAMGGPTTKR